MIIQKEIRHFHLFAGLGGGAKWDEPSGAVSAAACHDNGRWSVADPRIDGFTHGVNLEMPAANDKLVAMIRALDGTWHRPFTTLELAALQSLVDPEEYLVLMKSRRQRCNPRRRAVFTNEKGRKGRAWPQSIK